MDELKGRVQVNGSVGIMPSYLRDVLEPNAASMEERLKALQLCQERGVYAESVLAQPLFLPYMTHEALDEFFLKLKQANVLNIKPEFLTVDIQNLAFIAQFVNHFDPDKMKDFLEAYISPSNQDHRKQRTRLAPDRNVSATMLNILRDYASKHGVSISICNWVKKEMGAVDTTLKSIDRESRKSGYRCLGYQTSILDDDFSDEERSLSHRDSRSEKKK